MCYLEFYQWNKLQNAEKIAIYDFTIAEFMLSPAPLGKNAEIQKSNLSLWGVKKNSSQQRGRRWENDP